MFTVAFQLMETLALHEGGSRAARRARALQLLKDVEIPDPERRLDAFPHQLSGGMSQRVMLAMAIACNPRLLIADEPTTALDVTVQAQMLALLLRLQRERGMALVLITHDLGVVAEVAQRVARDVRGRRSSRARPRPTCSRSRAIRTPKRCSRRCPSATPGGAASPSLAGVVPGRVRPPGAAACSRRAARTSRERCRETRPPLFEVGASLRALLLPAARSPRESRGHGRRQRDARPCSRRTR